VIPDADPEYLAQQDVLADFVRNLRAAEPYRVEWRRLGPYTLPPLAPVRDHRLGQAFELLASLVAMERWPTHNTCLFGFLAYWLGQLAAREDVRRAAARNDTEQLALVALERAGIGPGGGTTEGDVPGATFEAYVADLVALEAAVWPTMAAEGLAGPFVVCVEDLLVDGCLIDLKLSTQNRCHTDWLAAIARRVIDVDQRGGLYTGVDQVAIYSARHPAVLSWPVDDFLTTVSGGRTRLDLEGEYERLSAPPSEWRERYAYNQGIKFELGRMVRLAHAP
jgi:hypothetical protein